MGRHSGFIAATATLAMNDVNYILVPESPFDIEGENGFLEHLEIRLRKRGHAVICVAEGAAQEILVKDKNSQKRDASGNLVLADVGLYLKEKIKEHFEKANKEVNIKYIDPSYIIRSSPANPNDSVFCILLGQHAVHAAMSGKTDIIIGKWNEQFTHIPIELAVSKRKKIDTKSSFWHSVLEATGQPINMLSPKIDKNNC
jgi:6-phosphofructokinase 1